MRAVAPARAEIEQPVAVNASIAATACEPAPSVVRRPAQTVTCTAALAGTTRTVQLTVRDTVGAVAVTSVS